MYFWGQTVRELLEYESLMSGEHESIRINLSDKTEILRKSYCYSFANFRSRREIPCASYFHPLILSLLCHKAKLPPGPP